MFTASHNPAQYNGIKLCRAGAAPVGQDTGLAEIRDARRASGRRRPRPAPRRARSPSATCSPTTPPTCASLVDLSGHPAAEGRRRRRQRDGRPHRARRCFDGAAARASSRCTSSSTARSPTTRPTRSSRRTCVDLQARGASSTAPTSGWPSTATPTAASSSTSAASRSRPSAITALVAARELAKQPGRDDHPQPDHLARGARDRRASTAATPVRTRVGHSFIKAEMAEHRRGLRRRALGALLLPRLLARRHRHARRAARARRARRAGPAAVASWSPSYERYAASGEINSDRRRRGRRASPRSRQAFAGRATASTSTTSTGSPSSCPTAGGSTCGRPTPSRCCGSTSRPPTTRRMSRAARRGARRDPCADEED